jgi:hypothetical protein
MILEGCSDQKSRSLEAFYTKIASDYISNEGGLAMLELIAALRSHSDPRQAWGLTSHYRLCLLARDTYTSPWYVIIGALDRRNFFVEYLMPERSSPWPGAHVKGEARALEDAVKMVLTAMDLSEGWAAL